LAIIRSRVPRYAKRARASTIITTRTTRAERIVWHAAAAGADLEDVGVVCAKFRSLQRRRAGETRERDRCYVFTRNVSTVCWGIELLFKRFRAFAAYMPCTKMFKNGPGVECTNCICPNESPYMLWTQDLVEFQTMFARGSSIKGESFFVT